MSNSIFLTSTVRSGLASNFIIIIRIAIVVYLAVTLSKKPNFFKNKKNIIGTTLGLCSGCILVSVMLRYSPRGTIYFMVEAIVVFIITCIVAHIVAQVKAKPTEKNLNATKPLLSNIDKLTKLKELLDAGAITQEEFEAKKKEILDM